MTALFETWAAMDPVLIWSFLTAGLLLNITPGTDVMFATACGVTGGPRAGIAAALGISTGALVHGIWTALGVAALIAANPAALDALRWAGAAYLIYLAIQAWRAPAPSSDTPAARSLRRAFSRGFVTNLLNPKVVLFFLALMPQFTETSVGPVWHQIILLTVIFTTTGAVVNSVYGTLAGLARNALKRSGRLPNRISSVIYTALAARLVAP